MEIKKYTVDEPESVGIFESILKYTTLTVITALLAYFAAFMLPFFSRSSSHNSKLRDGYFNLIFDNLELFNTLMALIAVGIMCYYIYSKYRFGRIFEIKITPESVELTVKNTFNNRIRKVSLPRNTLYIQRKHNKNELYGKFEIVTFFSAGKKVNYFSTAVSQWGNDEESYHEMMGNLD